MQGEIALLSDSAIIERLVHPDPKERIVISPMISASEQIGPSSVDVHLGTEFVVVERSDRVQFDPIMTAEEYKEWLNHVKSATRHSVLEQFILHPGEFALAATLEFIWLPQTIVAHIDGRSSWARQGLKVHSTAGNIHPGSRGFVVFELENVGPVPIILYPGLAIAQLTFDRMEGRVLEVESRYADVNETLWSAYPDDDAIRAMRALKSEVIARTSIAQQTRSDVTKRSDLRSADSAEQTDRFDDDEVLTTVADCLDVFDKTDLINIAEPLLAIIGTDVRDVTYCTESQLREILVEQCKRAYDTDAAGLRLTQKMLFSFLRQKMRRR